MVSFASRISTSISAGQVRGLGYMNQVSSVLRSSLERIETGNNINRASDDPSGMHRVTELEREIGGFQIAARNNRETYLEMIGVDDTQSGLINTMLELRSVVQKARNETDPNVQQALVANAADLISALDFGAREARFGETAVLSGGGTVSLGNQASLLLDTVNTNVRRARPDTAMNITFQAANAAERGVVSDTYTLPAANDSTFNISTEDGTVAVTLAAGIGLAAAVTQMNDDLGALGITVQENAGTLYFVGQNYGADASISYTHVGGDQLLDGGDASDSGVTGSVNINGTDFDLEGDLTVNYVDLDSSINFAFQGSLVENDPITGAAPTARSIAVAPSGGVTVYTGPGANTQDRVILGFRNLTSTFQSLLDITTTGNSDYMLDNPGGALRRVEEALSTLNLSISEVGTINDSLLLTQSERLGKLAEDHLALQQEIQSVDEAYEAARIAKMQILQQAGVSAMGVRNTEASRMLELLSF